MVQFRSTSPRRYSFPLLDLLPLVSRNVIKEEVKAPPLACKAGFEVATPGFQVLCSQVRSSPRHLQFLVFLFNMFTPNLVNVWCDLARDECKMQVLGVKGMGFSLWIPLAQHISDILGAVYKAFATYEEASEFVGASATSGREGGEGEGVNPDPPIKDSKIKDITLTGSQLKRKRVDESGSQPSSFGSAGQALSAFCPSCLPSFHAGGVVIGSRTVAQRAAAQEHVLKLLETFTSASVICYSDGACKVYFSSVIVVPASDSSLSLAASLSPSAPLPSLTKFDLNEGLMTFQSGREDEKLQFPC